ncbi:DUF4244 domain-containing protein [Streptomyces luteolus]|uniref:DUF4244 domain-containing protein n=1 Tax=Streptomyces luteolus TaxID=3043615 RepID=A0ABT6SZ24_9ACTN|nr:DUF4244 domain-containing protein [Streptomyces sp. B-S-A12]MDI3420445.1 DUF4244 domain-containing protein [Streptomyces sp. B-S-A12]
MPDVIQVPKITVAACGFAALLYKVVTSDAVRAALESIVGKALGVQV